MLLGYHLAAESRLPVFVFGTPAASSQDQHAGSAQAPAIQSGASTKLHTQAHGPSPVSSDPRSSPDSSEGRQTKRILGFAPNFQAVSADTHLSPLSLKQ